MGFRFHLPFHLPIVGSLRIGQILPWLWRCHEVAAFSRLRLSSAAARRGAEANITSANTIHSQSLDSNSPQKLNRIAMDYYEVLGLNRNANKEEIKEAFRKKAMQFHPDKHSASPKSVRDGATLRFKQASEAYEVLIDDSKRADYNLRFRSSGGGGYYGYGHSSNFTRGGGYYANREPLVSKLENFLRFLTSRAFLLNLSLAGALLGGTMIIESSRDRLWKMQNPGKSFEEAMEKMKDGKKKG